MNPSATRPWPVSPHYSTCDDVDVDEIIDDDEPEEKWHVQVAEGDVRVVSLEKLDDLFRFDVIDQNTFVWQPGMSNWVRLSSLLGASEPEQEDEFHVLFSPGNVRTLSLEQLDEFYRHSIIDEGTMVWRTGMHEWQTLGKVAGIDEAMLSSHPAPSVATVPASAKPTATVSAYAKTALPNVPPLSARPAQAASPSARGAQPANTAFPNVPPPSTRAGQTQRIPTAMPSVPPPSARAAQAQRTNAPVPTAPPPSVRAVQPANTVSASAPPTSARVPGGNAYANPARGAQYPNTGASAQAANAAQYANTFARTAPAASTRSVQYANPAAPVGSPAYARPQPAVSPGFVPSAPPVSFAVEPYAPAPRSRGGRWLLRFAVVVGALLALIQNDVIYGAIEKTPLAAQYESAERSLFGGPVFGTTRSVDRFIATTSTQLEPVRLPMAVTQFIDGQKHGSSSAPKSSDTGTLTAQVATPKSDAPTQPSQGSSTNATSRSESTASTTTTSTTTTSTTGANDSAKSHASHDRPGHATSSERSSSKASSHKAAPAAPSKKSSAPSGSKSGVKTGGSYYDPLNGAL